MPLSMPVLEPSRLLTGPFQASENYVELSDSPCRTMFRQPDLPW